MSRISTQPIVSMDLTNEVDNTTIEYDGTPKQLKIKDELSKQFYKKVFEFELDTTLSGAYQYDIDLGETYDIFKPLKSYIVYFENIDCEEVNFETIGARQLYMNMRRYGNDIRMSWEMFNGTIFKGFSRSANGGINLQNNYDYTLDFSNRTFSHLYLVRYPYTNFTLSAFKFSIYESDLI